MMARSSPRELHEIGDVPPLGVVPRRMYANVIRPDRFGEPVRAMRTEVVDVPRPGRGQMLVYVMAAGINYNNVFASLGDPVDVIAMRQRAGEPEDFHIGGSDGTGVVWAIGDGVEHFAVGDPVIMSACSWRENSHDIRTGAEPITSRSTRAWGYEGNYGSFAQFALVEEVQCHPKPAALTWEAAGCFLVTGATAYRQLCGWEPHTVAPGDPVLIWGGAGGLGSMAIQIVKLRGGIPIAVVSDDARAEYCRRLGAAGVINRREFTHWGRLPDIDDKAATSAWTRQARAFGGRIWDILGERRAPRIVLEHSGEDTIPTSMFVCDNAGMVVICGGTSGYNGDIDLRYLWMRQKRLQGSHFASTKQVREVIALVGAGRVDPCLAWCGAFEEIGEAHQLMYENKHPAGNMSVLVNAVRPGETALAEGQLASAGGPAW
jgi:crotonyl-CoA carboxylase/reductase